MKVTLTNDSSNPIKVMQRNPGGEGVSEANSASNEFTETFVQPGESLAVEGWYRAVEMIPGAPTVDPAQYIGGSD